MRIVVIGGDGYCGWPTSLHLAARGHHVTILDNGIRRRWDEAHGIGSLTPIATLAERVAAWNADAATPIDAMDVDVTEYAALAEALRSARPHAVVHFGQQRSAPFSMIDREHATETLTNNTIGNMNVLWAMRDEAPDAHLVKLGTMGEYGTPNIDVEEGFITITHKGRSDTLPFPKQPSSFYHLTKVSDSDHLFFACKTWGLRATDLNQGIVYGLTTDETPAIGTLVNRYDYDGIFGTVLNRFCVEAALAHPLSVYGAGGQTRSFLNIRDTVRCVEIAVEHPAEPGRYRVFNQFTEIFSVLEIAKRVRRVAATMGIDVAVEHVANPRVERETHYYSSVNAQLLALGLRPHPLDDALIREMIATASQLSERIDRAQILPGVRWAPERAVSSVSGEFVVSRDAAAAG